MKVRANPSASGVGQRVCLTADPRSVHSFLAGYDDGRAALWQRFEHAYASRAMVPDAEATSTAFAHFEMAAYLATRSLPWAWRPCATRWLMGARLHLATLGVTTWMI